MEPWAVVGVLIAFVGAVGAPWAVTWREILKLRASRHDTAQEMTEHRLTLANIQTDIAQIQGDVREVRDGLLASGLIPPARGI